MQRVAIVAVCAAAGVQVAQAGLKDASAAAHAAGQTTPAPTAPQASGWDAFWQSMNEGMQKASNHPYNTNTAKLSQDIPDTTVEGAGYVSDCDPKKCAGADTNYYMKASLKSITIPGSKNIVTATPGTYPNDVKVHTFSEEDVTFYTRHLEAMKDAPNSPFGPATFGGDGSGGLLGPALMALPGQSMNLFVMNEIDPDYQKKGYAPTAENYAQKVNNKVQTGSRMAVSLLGNTKSTIAVVSKAGEEVFDPVTAAQMDMNFENVPGWTTNHSFNLFNIHLHGMEVAPHLFHPMGSSDPKAPWITLEPTPKNGQQCYCYKFQIAPTQSKGLYAYHTHRHGTESMSTWSGMFGALLTDNYVLPSETPTAVLQATNNPATNPASSQMYNLVQMSTALGLPFEDGDVYPFILYNSMWKFKGKKFVQTNPTSAQTFPSATETKEASTVEVNGFLENQIPTTQLSPFLVNQEYQPTLNATAGHMSFFRIFCISAQYLCGFQVKNSAGKNLPFHVTASDGITFSSPVYFSTGAINTKLSVVESGAKVMFTVSGNKLGKEAVDTVESLEAQDQAYLQIGPGMRQDVIVQFPTEGTYTISQTGYPGLNAPQVLANIVVQASAVCGTTGKGGNSCKAVSLTSYQFTAARDVSSVVARPSARHVGLDFEQQLNRKKAPFVQWGVADQSGSSFQPYAENHTDMLATGGTCATWTIRSKDVIFHPFHIHVNPFVVQDVQMAPVAGKIEYTAALAQKLLTASAFYNPAFSNHWRDTVMIPPMGSVTLKQCFDAGPAADNIGTQLTRFAGKFVFHCHFLTHSDTGLMHNFMLTKGDPITPPSTVPSLVPGDCTTCPTVDPCGLWLSKGCVKCPAGATVEGCLCLVPAGSVPAMMQKYSSSDKDVTATGAAGGLRFGRAATVAGPALLGLMALGGLAIAGLRGSRGSSRVVEAVAVPTEEMAQDEAEDTEAARVDVHAAE